MRIMHMTLGCPLVHCSSALSVVLDGAQYAEVQPAALLACAACLPAFLASKE
jgi:hypothetical protein